MEAVPKFKEKEYVYLRGSKSRRQITNIRLEPNPDPSGKEFIYYKLDDNSTWHIEDILIKHHDQKDTETKWSNKEQEWTEAKVTSEGFEPNTIYKVLVGNLASCRKDSSVHTDEHGQLYNEVNLPLDYEYNNNQFEKIIENETG